MSAGMLGHQHAGQVAGADVFQQRGQDVLFEGSLQLFVEGVVGILQRRHAGPTFEKSWVFCSSAPLGSACAFLAAAKSSMRSIARTASLPTAGSTRTSFAPDSSTS